MDAVEFFKELERMSLDDNEGFNELGFITKIEDRVKFVEVWSTNHQKKTRLQDFLEKYPKATFGTIDTEDSSYPDACCAFLGYCDCVRNGNKEDCKKCWNEPVD